MSKNFETATAEANEIVKAADFEFAHNQAVNNAALAIQAIMAEGGKDFIVGGKVQPYPSGGMNFVISPVYGHCAGSGIDFIEASGTQQPVSVENASPAFDRIDTVQVRGITEPYDFQDRKFRDPATGIETVETIATKKKIVMEVSVKKGADGSVAAPPADAGFIKLAEIAVPAATVGIHPDNIKNITARTAESENGGWTADKSRTFNPGYASDITAALFAGHEENGSHKNNAIAAANILFGSQAGAVNGLAIPTGEPVKVLETVFSALSGITEVLAALGLGVNNAYAYANGVLGRYAYTNHMPAAASTENIDVAAGGEAVIDGIACAAGQMVFLKDQDDKKQNGFWEAQTGAWNRYPGYAAGNAGCFTHKLVLVKKGDSNAGKVFYLENDGCIPGADPLDFKESIFSPDKIPGKVPIRDNVGQTAESRFLHCITLSTYPSPGQTRIMFSLLSERNYAYTFYDIAEIMESIRGIIMGGNGPSDSRWLPAMASVSPMGAMVVDAAAIRYDDALSRLLLVRPNIGGHILWDFNNQMNNDYSFYPDACGSFLM